MRPPTLYVVAAVWETWRAEAARSPWRETGGILLGYRTSTGDVVLTHAAGPGPRARRTTRGLELDGEHGQRALEAVYAASRGALTFLGDWHTHPLGGLRPSAQDEATARGIAADPRYRTPAPLLVIYGPTAWAGCGPLRRWLPPAGVGAYVLADGGEETLATLRVRAIPAIPQ